ncbi:hypothetical protein A2995_00985 [Candidatus Nomurabacteria bacterium RIFCSPLOWO2_01_FULL_33_24]|uniref:Uncharacterized protein n=1 Tax=Candidatus Nomurabacteria bacterium RIFCSPLOWO2_01_FULL_33_24 TaxID=1801765 RepID=A0A1F6X2X4_9BACT|nr:MAG: hypothetical protein A2995_00985 [Candidatus Nomurabacteria bacterium RIFCSPLOWO2_01_FULL_33_24]
MKKIVIYLLIVAYALSIVSCAHPLNCGGKRHKKKNKWFSYCCQPPQKPLVTFGAFLFHLKIKRK